MRWLLLLLLLPLHLLRLWQADSASFAFYANAETINFLVLPQHQLHFQVRCAWVYMCVCVCKCGVCAECLCAMRDGLLCGKCSSDRCKLWQLQRRIMHTKSNSMRNFAKLSLSSIQLLILILIFYNNNLVNWISLIHIQLSSLFSACIKITWEGFKWWVIVWELFIKSPLPS